MLWKACRGWRRPILLRISHFPAATKLSGAAPLWVTAGACWLYCRQASSTRFSFRLDPTPPHTHISSSTHLTDLVSLLQPPHIIFPLRSRGGALSSFLWSFYSEIDGTGQTWHHTRIFYQQSLFCLVSAEECTGQLCWALPPPSSGDEPLFPVLEEWQCWHLFTFVEVFNEVKQQKDTSLEYPGFSFSLGVLEIRNILHMNPPNAKFP